MTPFELMQIEGITDEELISHWEAHEYLSRQGSKAKLKNIPEETREKIAKFYAKCRAAGYYAGRPSEGKMLWQKVESYEVGMERLRKKAYPAPKSLAAMEGSSDQGRDFEPY